MEKTIRKFKAILRFLKKTHGQDLVEYALLVALIALACTAGMKTLANDINSAFTSVSTSLTTYVNSGGGSNPTTGGGGHGPY